MQTNLQSGKIRTKSVKFSNGAARIWADLCTQYPHLTGNQVLELLVRNSDPAQYAFQAIESVIQAQQGTLHDDVLEGLYYALAVARKRHYGLEV
jgi:hypothetical protein